VLEKVRGSYGKAPSQRPCVRALLCLTYPRWIFTFLAFQVVSARAKHNTQLIVSCAIWIDGDSGSP